MISLHNCTIIKVHFKYGTSIEVAHDQVLSQEDIIDFLTSRSQTDWMVIPKGKYNDQVHLFREADVLYIASRTMNWASYE